MQVAHKALCISPAPLLKSSVCLGDLPYKKIFKKKEKKNWVPVGHTYVTTSKASQLRKRKHNSSIDNENDKGILFKGKMLTLPYSVVSVV